MTHKGISGERRLYAKYTLHVDQNRPWTLSPKIEYLSNHQEEKEWQGMMGTTGEDPSGTTIWAHCVFSVHREARYFLLIHTHLQERRRSKGSHN